MAAERWVSIPGFPRYEISSDARIRSLAHVDRGGLPRKQRFVQPNGKQCQVQLMAPSGRIAELAVGRLMLMAFIKRAANGEMALHWDDNPWNNALTNLRWGDGKKNAEDAVRNGRYKKTPGFTGRKHTAESRSRISLSNMGRPVTEQTRAKLSTVLKGRVFNPDTIARMSEAQLARYAREGPRTLSPEAREKIRMKALARHAKNRAAKLLT